MNKELKKHLSLREIGRILEIPPSTVVYYRDRFPKYIPAVKSHSGRWLYPHSSLEIFKTIRQCYRDKWNKDQTETVLAEKFPTVRQTKRPDQVPCTRNEPQEGTEPQMAQNLDNAINKLASALDRQEEVFGQLRRMELKIQALQNDRAQSEEKYKQHIDQLVDEIDRLKAPSNSYRQQNTNHSHRFGKGPGHNILFQPMTVHYPPDRYLGLKDPLGRSLNIDQMIGTIEANAFGPKAVTLTWREHQGVWTMNASLKTPVNNNMQTLRIKVRATRTPKGNEVTEVMDMFIAGQRLSKDELLKFFKLLRAGIAGFDHPESNET